MKQLLLATVILAVAAVTIVSSRPSDCFDEKADCPAWANRGDCKYNAEWMLNHCRASCNFCSGGDGGQGQKCRDNEADCPRWAQRGDCRSNPAWMQDNCRLSCRTC